MALFAASEDAEDPQEKPRLSGRARAGWVLLAVAVAAVLLMGFAPAPYVIEQPGPVFNTLGVDSPVGQKAPADAKPVLTISGAPTYPTSGALDLLTDNGVGDPQQLPSWFQVAAAWFYKSKAVVPVAAEFPSGQTGQQSDQQNAVLMSDSQEDAAAAALNVLGYSFSQRVLVSGVEKGSPAAGRLRAGDQITAVDGVTVKGTQSLRDAIAKNGTGAPATLTVVRGGRTRQLSVTPVKEDGTTVIGVYVGMKYGRMPVGVHFQLADIGGPSAGQMFALGIIDKLTSGSLNGGLKVAGTGTIDNEGNVGAIGGIRQKLYGARAAGATVFLAPRSNCDEVVGHVPSGLKVFAVTRLSQSLTVLKTVAAHKSTAGLPTCR